MKKLSKKQKIIACFLLLAGFCLIYSYNKNSQSEYLKVNGRCVSQGNGECLEFK